MTSSGSPSVGRKRARPRNAEAKTCPRDPSNLTRVTRSGIEVLGLARDVRPASVIDDLLSSTATDHDALAPSFAVKRACACRIDGKAIGDSKSIVLGKFASSTNVDQACPAIRPLVAAVGLAQAQHVAAAVEVGFDVHPQLAALDRAAHVERQAGLARMKLRVGALAAVDRDGARVEAVFGADRIEVADHVELDPSARLERKRRPS